LKRVWPIALLLALALVAGGATRAAAPILILISFDGFRWDYINRGETPNLEALASHGVRAQGLIPSFPSFTFPNHYTIATGLYPEHHGIVANTMDDPRWPERFSMTSPTSREQRWWGGQPIWVTARLQGLRSAGIFWPGSDVAVNGIPPNAALSFDDKMPNADIVNHVLELLARPESERPSVVAAYFAEVDHAGHDSGPDSPEMPEALRHVDGALGLLEAGLRDRHLADRTTIVVVSDHGMAPLSDQRVIFLDDYVDLSTVEVVEWGEMVQLRPKVAQTFGSAGATVDDVYRAIKGKHPSMTVYRREEMPERFHYRDNPRIQPVLALAAEGWEITSHARWRSDLDRHRKRGGAHGYDPRLPSMHGLFVASGPRVKRGVVAKEFENVHIYDFLCDVLGLTPAKNDGDPGVTRSFLVPNP